MRIRAHPARDLTRVHAFTWPIFSNYTRLAKIDLAGDALYQRFRAGNDRSDLKWTLQETLEKQCTHEMRTVVLRPLIVQQSVKQDRFVDRNIHRQTFHRTLTDQRSPITYHF